MISIPTEVLDQHNQPWGTYSLTHNGLSVLSTEISKVRALGVPLPEELLAQGSWRILLGVRTDPLAYTDIAIIMRDGIIEDMTGIGQLANFEVVYRDEEGRKESRYEERLFPLRSWPLAARQRFTRKFAMHHVFAVLDDSQQSLAWAGSDSQHPPNLEARISSVEILDESGAIERAIY